VTRTLLTGGLVFDGTGAPPAEADVLIEGRIVEVGPGLDGDEAVDVAAATCCRSCSTATPMSP
jgi:N-acyl-D-aspartate/D-glutamate deacylase